MGLAVDEFGVQGCGPSGGFRDSDVSLSTELFLSLLSKAQSYIGRSRNSAWLKTCDVDHEIVSRVHWDTALTQ